MDLETEGAQMVVSRIIGSKVHTMFMPHKMKSLETVTHMGDQMFKSFCFPIPEEDCVVL